MDSPPEGWPRIAPAVFYDDAAAAIDWLVSAFGFTVRVRVENDQGQIVHSQLAMNGGLIMVGQAGLTPGRTYPRSPRAVGGANTQALAVFVDDVDAHCETARAAGAVIATEPATQDYGKEYWTERTYEAEDLEGHHWWFLQRL
ncbi:MAG: VOC family protein [Gemmatimonadota bacterium]|nr:VOC family protein [Gemmatimonadota bacterium]MDE2866452.1 VOC family protein [Gemmatimonadota bacterium]MXV96431.1 aminotransferase [Gemmatimonadota bacterium]MYB06388.1 aminotransferase [Gemmatimonadota bacterium]MYE16944.1 aminotransferase [Gemmatimonadota bacterium]